MIGPLARRVDTSPESTPNGTIGSTEALPWITDKVLDEFLDKQEARSGQAMFNQSATIIDLLELRKAESGRRHAVHFEVVEPTDRQLVQTGLEVNAPRTDRQQKFAAILLIDVTEPRSSMPGVHQVRSITVREAARLPSFDDSVVLCGSHSDQWVQVGNAVRPLLGQAIARSILVALGRKR
jgi:site-specific DNA-cytosine methylase